MWIESRKNDKIRRSICVIFGICVSLILTCVVTQRQEVLASQRLAKAQTVLADEVFRFHVLANSDSEEDQNLKLKVRDEVLAYIWGNIPESEQKSAESVKLWVIDHLDEMKDVASKVVYEEGYHYPVNLQVTRCYFPDRRYGEILFPKGYYEALRVEIGDALGHNWWCALYPSLCFTDAVCAVVTEEGEQELRDAIGEEAYEEVTVTSNNFEIKSFFYELFKEKMID